MDSSALNYPRLQWSKQYIPGLATEAVQLVHDVVAAIAAEHLVSSAHDKGMQPFVDPETGLDLLPIVEPTYRHRTDRSQGPDAFLKSSAWGPLAENHLIYSEHLRRVDTPLYSALLYRAVKEKVEERKYLFKLGIFTKSFIASPPKGYERQAGLMKALRMQLRAQTLSDSAVKVFMTRR